MVVWYILRSHSRVYSGVRCFLVMGMLLPAAGCVLFDRIVRFNETVIYGCSCLLFVYILRLAAETRS